MAISLLAGAQWGIDLSGVGNEPGDALQGSHQWMVSFGVIPFLSP